MYAEGGGRWRCIWCIRTGLFCETLDYNMLFRWFLDMGLEEASLDHSTFSRNRERLIEHDIAKEFFSGAIEQAREQGCSPMNTSRSMGP